MNLIHGPAKMKFIFYAVMVVLFEAVYAQGSASIVVNFRMPEDQSVTLGKELRFVCDVNINLEYLINEGIEIYIIHKSPGEDSEVILTQTVQYIKAEKENYHVSLLQTPGNGITLDFVILKVRLKDEGKFTCRLKKWADRGGHILGENHQEIEIPKPLDVLYLKLSDIATISKSTTDYIKVDAGPYIVACTAEGSHPASTVHLYLNGSLVPDVENKAEKMDPKLNKWRTQINGSVRLTILNSKQTIKCEAQSPLGDKRIVELPFKIKIYDPTIACNDSEARIGQHDIVITCTVDYEDLSITGFKCGFGDEETVEEDKKNDFAIVSKEQLTDTKVRVHLKLDKVEKEHFEKEFYLIVMHADGHETRQSVRLQQISDHSASKDNNGSFSNLNPALATLSLLCTLWLTRLETDQGL